MSTEAQQSANKLNAQHSCGPKTAAGKAASSQNNWRHGFAGIFRVLECESLQQYDQMLLDFECEYQPLTPTENVFVERMAQHQWLIQRALQLQNLCFEGATKPEDHDRSLALYMRYQTTNERAFSRCLHDLLKLRSERRKQDIGFESQARQKEENARKQAVDIRKQDLHKLNVWLAEAKAEHQELLNAQLETPETRNPNRAQRILARQQAA